MVDVNAEQLSAYADGDLSQAERLEFEKELEARVELRQELDELHALKALARSFELAPPARDLWPQIREQIEAPPWYRQVLRWAPALGAAALAAGLAVAMVPRPKDPSGERPNVSAARAAYEAAIDDVTDRSLAQTEKLPEATRVALLDSLRQVDEAIAKAEMAIRDAPNDMFAHTMLLSLYDEKLRVLQAVAEEEGS